jgi:acyl carrier protein
MSNTELLSTIQEVIRSVLNNQAVIVTAEKTLINDLGLESIDLLDISSELENSLGWEIDFRDVAEFTSKASGKPMDTKSISVQNLMDFINTKNN